MVVGHSLVLARGERLWGLAVGGQQGQHQALGGGWAWGNPNAGIDLPGLESHAMEQGCCVHVALGCWGLSNAQIRGGGIA